MVSHENKVFHEILTTIITTLECNEQLTDAVLIGVKYGGHDANGTSAITLEFEGVLFAKEIVALGNAFGDENPLVETKDNKLIVTIYNSLIN